MNSVKACSTSIAQNDVFQLIAGPRSFIVTSDTAFFSTKDPVLPTDKPRKASNTEANAEIEIVDKPFVSLGSEVKCSQVLRAKPFGKRWPVLVEFFAGCVANLVGVVFSIPAAVIKPFYAAAMFKAINAQKGKEGQKEVLDEWSNSSWARFLFGDEALKHMTDAVRSGRTLDANFFYPSDWFLTGDGVYDMLVSSARGESPQESQAGYEDAGKARSERAKKARAVSRLLGAVVDCVGRCR